MIEGILNHGVSLLAIVFTFGVVIILHEGGHFAVCRMLGVRVERFAFGFGPEIFGVTHGDTRYSICAIPLGGFVKPAGEVLEDATGEPDEFFSRSPWHRLLIVWAGPAMNYILSFAIFTFAVLVWGLPAPTNEAVIGALKADYPAAQAGLLPGDKIVELDGIEISQWNEMASFIHARADKTVKAAYMRDGTRQTVEITPRNDKASGHGLIGIMPQMVKQNVGLFSAMKIGVHQCWYWTALTVNTIKEKIIRRERPDLAGPVGIMQMVSSAAHDGLENFVILIGILSVAIGFFNILPVPLLDGGHAALYMWEWISGRKLTLQVVGYANSLGMAFLLSLLVFATYNDFLRWYHSGQKGATVAEETVSPQTDPAAIPEPAQ